MKMSIFFVVLLTLFSKSSLQKIDGINLIPWPVHIEELPGIFLLKDNITIFVPKGDAEIKICSDRLQEIINKSFGLTTHVEEYVTNQETSGDLSIIFSKNDSITNEEGYRLLIRSYGIEIQGSKAHGMYHAVTTLQQLFPLPSERSKKSNSFFTLRCLEIEDYPRFPYRGWMVDVGRHFSSVENIKKDIDLLALHKMSIFHFHLTEDQGWRVEIKKYPKLTEIGAWRGGANLMSNSDEDPVSGFVDSQDVSYDSTEHINSNGKYGGFYTQEQIKDIVAHAKKRFIRIQPEIEMPGHAVAAIASYPELSCSGKQVSVITSWGIFTPVFCSKEETIVFLQDVLTEVMDLFPDSPMIHIGGDECPSSDWQRCDNCKARMEELNITQVGYLHGFFIRRVADHCAKRKRRLIGWEEIMHGGKLPDDTAVMVWRGSSQGGTYAKAGRDVVVAPMGVCYFDFSEANAGSASTSSSFSSSSSHSNGKYSHFFTSQMQSNSNGLQNVYNWDPMVAALGAPPSPMNESYQKSAVHILGSQGNLWTERLPEQRNREYNSFPRLTALSEALWAPYGKKDYDDFINRLSYHFIKFYDEYNVTYNKNNLLK